MSPRLPRIDPNPSNQLTTESPNALQRVPQQTGNNISTVGETMSGVGDMFRKANLLAEETKATNDLEAKLADIKVRAEQDPDNSAAKRKAYDDEINKSISDSSQHVSIPEERGLFSLNAQNKANITKAHVDGIFHAKTVNNLKVDSDIFFDKKKNDFISTQNPKEKEMAVLDRDAQIQKMIGAGALTEAQATELKYKQDRDWAKSQVEYDIGVDPEGARDKLKSKDYENIDEEDRVSLLDKANSAIKKNSQDAQDQIELIQFGNVSKYLASQANGELSWKNLEDISSDVRQGILPPKFGEAFTNVIKAQGEGDAYEPQEKQNENYPDFVASIYNAKDKKELQTALLGLLKENKNISEDKMAILINGAMERSKNLGLRPLQIDPKQSAVDSGAKAIVQGISLGLDDPQDKSDIYHDYMKGVSGGQEPKEALDNAMKTHVIKKNPAVLNYPIEGQPTVDPEGNKAIIFPDGSWKDLGAKASGSATAKKDAKSGIQSK